MRSNTPPPLQNWLRFSPWLFAVGMIFWLSSFGLLGLSIDQENALFRDDHRAWLSQGRWVVFLLSQYLYSQPVLMYFPHLMYVLCMVGSYVLLMVAFTIDFRQRWLALLAFPVFMAHPVWYFIAEFAANLVPTALGMVAVSVAVWLFAQRRYALLQVGLLCVALGSYQSLIFIAAVLYAALLIQHYSQQSRLCFKPFIRLLLIMGGSLLLNTLVVQGLMAVYHTTPDYIGHHIYLGFWLEQPAQALRIYLRALLYLYAGNSKVYTSTLFASGLMMLWALGLLILQQRRAQPVATWPLRLMVALLLLSVVLIPLVPQILIANGSAPHRTLLAIATTVWLATLYVLLHVPTGRLQWLAVAGVMVLNVQLLHLHARYDSAKYFLYNHDRQVAQQLYGRILHLLPDYNPQTPHLFSVHGALDYRGHYGDIPNTVLNGSFFLWDGGSNHRITNYMRSQNINGLEPVDTAQQAALAPIYAAMPVWPQAGSVQLHEGVILVKLGP